MQEASNSHPSTTFAGLMSTLTGSPPRPAASWAEDALPEDVAVLSYEQALRAQSRWRPESPGENLFACSSAEAKAAIPTPPAERDSVAAPPGASPAKESLNPPSLKSASVTIRMSQVESEALHQRATEAGMTVSAYLRYCAMEVESLRGLVRQTTAELKEAMAAAKPTRREASLSWRQRIAGWITPWRELRQTARA